MIPSSSRFMLIILTLLLYSSVTSALIGFDCSHNDLQYARIDLTATHDCNLEMEKVTSKTISAQLIQLTDTLPITVYRCSVTVHRTVTYCGMHSHSATVLNGVYEYPLILNRERCIQAIKTGELCLWCGTSQQVQLVNLVVDKSLQETKLFAGSVDNVGTCQGAPYSDQFGKWDNVIVQGWIRVTLSRIDTTADTNNNLIHLPHSINCAYTKTTCQDLDGGEFYWDAIPSDSCRSSTHMVLFQGPANITTAIVNSNKETRLGDVVTVMDADISFSLQLRNVYSICNQEAYTTEHPKLIIIIKTGFDFQFTKSSVKVNSLDLFTYFNSKFVFIERHFKTNLERLYNTMLEQRCRMEKETLYLKMAIAEINPQQFAYLHTTEPGHHAFKSGEVIYMTKCSPVVVTVRNTNACYDELPVVYKNQSYFLSPKNRLIQKHGTEINCNILFPPMFKLTEKWYQIVHNPVTVEAPIQLGPSNFSKWKYESLQGLATSGIYSQTELDTLRDHLMYGPERHAMENIIVRGALGAHPDLQGLQGVSLLDPEELNHLTNQIISKIWGWFSIFGTLSSGMIGLVFIVKAFKWLLDAIINGTVLYSIYGFSFKLIGCIFDSLTHCLVHKYNSKNNQNNSNGNTGDDELKELVTLKSVGDNENMNESGQKSSTVSTENKNTDTQPNQYIQKDVELSMYPERCTLYKLNASCPKESEEVIVNEFLSNVDDDATSAVHPTPAQRHFVDNNQYYIRGQQSGVPTFIRNKKPGQLL